VLLLVAGRMSPDFVAPGTQAELLSHVWETALLALPMTLLILTGGIDLSVGSTMALSAVVFGLAFRAGLGPVVGSLLALGTGALAGALNGLFVARVRVHPLIVTLATLAAYRGIAEGISLARPVSGFPPRSPGRSAAARCPPRSLSLPRCSPRLFLRARRWACFCAPSATTKRRAAFPAYL
jgi:rhamnose transport system permease protein